MNENYFTIGSDVTKFYLPADSDDHVIGSLMKTALRVRGGGFGVVKKTWPLMEFTGAGDEKTSNWNFTLTDRRLRGGFGHVKKIWSPPARGRPSRRELTDPPRDCSKSFFSDLFTYSNLAAHESDWSGLKKCVDGNWK